MRVLSPLRISAFSRLTCPLLLGCATDAKHMDAYGLAIALEDSTFELGPIIRNYTAWDAKSAHNGLEECSFSFLGHAYHRGCLRPFCEFVNGDKEVLVPTDSLWERSQDV